MDHVHHFSYGPVTPVVAYLMSFVGSLLGLRCTARARASQGSSRASWLALAALAIGGTGIWVMHFIAMLGFRVPGAEIRYDVGLTALSAVMAIVIVGIGVFLVGFGGVGAAVVLPAGFITGLGVAVMHYTGMAALNMSADVGYEPPVVGLSVLIAVVAATAALWFTVRVKGLLATVGAAAIMGVAVTGMHYTGMLALTVDVLPEVSEPSGAGTGELLLPSVLVVSVVAVLLLMVVSVNPSEDEMNRLAELERRVVERRNPASGPPERALRPPAPKKGSNQWFGG
jgi:NO-binding membrane sensor protein with MHYT domain